MMNSVSIENVKEGVSILIIIAMIVFAIISSEDELNIERGRR